MFRKESLGACEIETSMVLGGPDDLHNLNAQAGLGHKAPGA